MEWVSSKMRQILGDGTEIVVPNDASENALLPWVRDVDVAVGRLTDKLVKEARNLRLIQVLSTGVDTYAVDLSLLKSKGILLATASGGNATAVAEHALALMFALAKKVVLRHQRLQNDEWDKGLSIQMRGKTLGIYGLGKIGEELARMAGCLGMKVVAIKRDPSREPSKTPCLEWVGSFADLDRLLSESDFVAVCAASTSETRGSLTLDRLRRMKKTAYLIVVSRGNIVDEEGLLQALNDGNIAGAALDVWWQYPPKTPSQRNLHKHPKVTASSHIGGDTEEAVESLIELAASNIKALADGKELVNVVSFRNEY